MSAGFQVSYNLQGDVVVADGVVIQPKSGVRLTVGGGNDLTGRSVLPGERGLTVAVASAASTAVGGSARNLVCSGLASLEGLFFPTIPDTFKRGDLTLLVTGASAAEISDGTDVIAILSTGGTAPVGDYVGTTYGRATYNATAAFTLAMVAEEGSPGAIPDVLVTINSGTAMGGIYTATDAANYVSAADADWTLFLDPDGSAELRYLGTAVATRADGEGHDPSGRFLAVEAGYFYNPLPAREDDAPGVDTVNPYGVLTLVYSWPATPDLDIGVTFLGETVGYGHASSGTYLTWSGDDTGPTGSETVTIDLEQAWADGVISSVAEVICAADWFPSAGGSGLATLDVDYTVGAFSGTLSIAPGDVSPAASLVASLRILADGSVTNEVGPWQAHVRIIGRLPREGFAYLEVIEDAGVLETVNGPFFATELPVSSGSTFYVPLAFSDGTKVEQFHTGALIWDRTPAEIYSTGLAWVSLTQAAYDALSPPDPDTIYDITDAEWGY